MEPDLKLSRQVLSAPLRRAIEHVFSQNLQGCVLVGGTAIAGYYAGHRKSDDMDLFTKDAAAQIATIKACQSLTQLGAQLAPQQQTPSYYKATCTFDGHIFTIDIVLDAHLHQVGHTIRLENAVVVADLSTLLKMKASTLISRCSEKDLYDIKWILGEMPEVTINDLLKWALEMDPGATPESLYTVVASTVLRKEACDFSLSSEITPEQIYKELRQFKKELAKSIEDAINKKPLPPLGKLFRLLK
ncbi:MAG: nucleotidyl transferase AbiEii/AbiGii toxin family protein [Bdellovibrio sp.]|nr:nucleotidyl transferase AbiEii/AbiGii toxin family protein [Bdellovibrio sp.]